jgi:hypothetical protein
MTYWNSGTQVSEFRKARFELVKTKKLLFRNKYFGDQVYEVSMDHIFIRNQALQPRVKTIISVQENDLKYLLIKKLFSSYLIGDFISSTLDVDTRTHEVEFPDGQMAELAANVIAQNMYIMCDIEGNQYLLLQGIVDHRKEESAIDRVDMYVQRGSNRHFPEDHERVEIMR